MLDVSVNYPSCLLSLALSTAFLHNLLLLKYFNPKRLSINIFKIISLRFSNLTKIMICQYKLNIKRI